jgi:hypothetical protein
MEKPFDQVDQVDQAVVVEAVCCILIVLGDMVMMIRIEVGAVVDKATEVVLGILGAEALVVVQVVDWGMGWRPGQVDRRCSLRLTSCLREAYVAVKKVWLHEDSRSSRYAQDGLLESGGRVGLRKRLANA